VSTRTIACSDFSTDPPSRSESKNLYAPRLFWKEGDHSSEVESFRTWAGLEHPLEGDIEDGTVKRSTKHGQKYDFELAEHGYFILPIPKPTTLPERVAVIRSLIAANWST
jgi:hypothetical protein